MFADVAEEVVAVLTLLFADTAFTLVLIPTAFPSLLDALCLY